MEVAVTAFIGVLLAIVSAGAAYFFGVLKFQNETRWEMKRDACLKALEVVDEVLSTWHFTQAGHDVDVMLQKKDVSKARQAHSELWISCELATVTAYLDAIGMRSPDEPPKPTGPAKLSAFRNAVREELGLDPHLDPHEIEANRIFVASV